MKKLNNLLNKVGVDKTLHFVIGALLNALFYPFGFEYTIIGIMWVFILSCIKELIDSFEKDDFCDWYDVIASVAGAASMCLYYCTIV